MAPVKNGFHEHCSAHSELYLTQWVSERVGVPFRSNLPPRSPHLISKSQGRAACWGPWACKTPLPFATPLEEGQLSQHPSATLPPRVGFLLAPHPRGPKDLCSQGWHSGELLREPAPLPLAGGDRANIFGYILLLFLSGRVWTLV